MSQVSAETAVSGPQDSGIEQFSDYHLIISDHGEFLSRAALAFAESWAKHRNQIRAYRTAYPNSSLTSARKYAGLMFRDANVQAEIRRITNAWADHSSVKAMQVEHELSRLVFADPRLLYDAKGKLLKPHDWDADTAAAVESYSETPTRYGIIRKVKLHDKHSPARTLLEAKGAFDKHKAPPGVQASFTINLGSGTQALGAPAAQDRSVTIDVDTTRKTKVPKKAAPKKQAAIAAPGKRGPLFGDQA